jgi:hypothetical protein
MGYFNLRYSFVKKIKFQFEQTIEFPFSFTGSRHLLYRMYECRGAQGCTRAASSFFVILATSVNYRKIATIVIGIIDNYRLYYSSCQ